MDESADGSRVRPRPPFSEGAEPATPPAKPFADLPSCCQQGHAFSKRFSSVAPTPAQIEAIDDLSQNSTFAFNDDVIASFFENVTSYTYVCDVCDRCGLTVGR